jgi:hypothetical protein
MLIKDQGWSALNTESSAMDEGAGTKGEPGREATAIFAGFFCAKSAQQMCQQKGDTKMGKTGVLIFVFLVLAVMPNCTRENSGPAEATQEVLAGSSEAASVEQGTNGIAESQTGTTEAGKPRIAFAQKEFDFGKVETGERIEHVYEFRNTGNGTLLIHKVRSG